MPFVTKLHIIGSLVAGGILGLVLPDVAKFFVGRGFGGDVSFTYSFSFRQLEAEFSSAQQLRDWQIRAVGGVKILFLASLLAYLATLFPPQTELEYGIMGMLFAGVTRISWTDLLAIENPHRWSMEITKMYSYHGKHDVFPDYLPSIRERFATYLSFIVLLLFISGLILEHQGVIDYIKNSDNPPYEIKIVGQILAGVGSVIFSIILVMLYDKQASISNTQSEVQKEQKDLMRRDREPRLSGPYNFRFWGSYPTSQSPSSPTTDARYVDREPNPNSIQFFQTNAGEGLAQNFRLKVILGIDRGPHEGRGAVCAVQRMDRFPLNKFGESDIQGGEKDVEFMTEELKLSFTEPNPDDYPDFGTYNFKQGINKLCYEGTYKITLTFKLVWEDEFEDTYEDQVYHTTSYITTGMDLLDVVR